MADDCGDARGEDCHDADAKIIQVQHEETTENDACAHGRVGLQKRTTAIALLPRMVGVRLLTIC